MLFSQTYLQSKSELMKLFGSGDLMLRSRLRVRRFPESVQVSTKEVFMAHVKPVVVKCSPADVARKFGEEVGAQMSTSSSDHDSKLRGPSQNSPRVALKQDVNKLN
ncbi:hypothetical protein AVEN_13973-1 [Araneus ventricosus]|uniref:Uncharacterized protein n=1 Tax=Araneus ventricosus TaxID=182803 RepID=A0A4Y2V0W2_ARAVE|nr:hypothetical protein AVEN_234881-1 [Araneus ventricosus]GBO17696.1 hypothetical protein AVEN_13973-1 [Araneus ventricosus]